MDTKLTELIAAAERANEALPYPQGPVKEVTELVEYLRKEQRMERPRIICLCGSTRFYKQFQEANYQETMAGRIVLSVGFYPHAEKEMHHEEHGCTPEQKVALDELHKRKIDLADEVFVLNVGGYIGSSTRSEIEYAEATGKPIRYLERDSSHASS